MLDKVKKYDIILASGSPRRKELLKGLELDFTVWCLKDIDESYPADLDAKKVAEFISEKKAMAYKPQMSNNQLIITADTVVVVDGTVLGKPSSIENAKEMLRKLSGKTHSVITGVTVLSSEKHISFSAETEVKFADLQEDEIDFYVNTFKPLDKAGAYGIQEWIGYIGIENIKGSYFNVMGLPVQRLYTALKNW